MDHFELVVRQRKLDQKRHVLFVEEVLPVGKCLAHSFLWRGDEDSVVEVRSSDPVLTGSEFSGATVPPANTGEQTFMNLAQQTH